MIPAFKFLEVCYNQAIKKIGVEVIEYAEQCSKERFYSVFYCYHYYAKSDPFFGIHPIGTT